MKFVKRLIIMSGENKGTLSIEKNASYVSAKFNSFGKSVLNGTLVMLIDGQKHYRKLNGDKESFSIETESLDAVHAAVFCADKLVMYGTNEPKRLTAAQIDALRVKKRVLAVEDTGPLPDKIFSSREHIGHENKGNYIENKAEHIELSTDGAAAFDAPRTEYVDDAISETNYYPPEFSQTEPEEHMADIAAGTVERDAGELPSLRCSSYLQALRESYISKVRVATAEKSAQAAAPVREAVPAREAAHSEYKEERAASLRDSAAVLRHDNAQTPLKETAAAAFAPNAERVERILPVQKEIHIAAREGNFYERNGDDIEKIFAQSEQVKDLEGVLPGSKWVRIEYNESGKYYVMGLIGKEYLCYGLPAEYTPAPPEELKGYCWWLPLKPEKPKGKGYWIMYQSLKTGEAVLPPE